MARIKNLLLVGLGVTIVAVSCKKKEDTPAPAPSKTDLLCGKTYKMTGITVNPGINMGGTTVTDMWSYVPACSKDDEVTFKTTGKVTTDEGATKCDSADVQTYDEDWKFISSETKVELTERSGKKKEYTVITLNGTDFKTSYVETDSSVTPPVDRTYTVTMKKK